MNKFISLLAVALLFASCSSLDSDKVESTQFSVIATLVSNNDNGAIFSTNKLDDSPEVTYTSSRTVKDVNPAITPVPGNRYVILFTNDTNEAYKSGPISLQNVVNIINGKLVEADAATIAADCAQPFTMRAVERSGNFLNMEIGAATMGNVNFRLLVDQSTLGNAYPDVYVSCICNNSSLNESIYLASINLNPVWSLPSCSGIKLHYNGLTKTFENNKKGFTPGE